MKCLVWLLLITCFAAAVTPCCAAEVGSAENTAGHEDKNEGSCSPFVTCAGCAAAVVTPQKIEIASVLVYSAPHNTIHIAGALSCYTPSFWQPPRAGF